MPIWIMDPTWTRTGVIAMIILMIDGVKSDSGHGAGRQHEEELNMMTLSAPRVLSGGMPGVLGTVAKVPRKGESTPGEKSITQHSQ